MCDTYFIRTVFTAATVCGVSCVSAIHIIIQCWSRYSHVDNNIIILHHYNVTAVVAVCGRMRVFFLLHYLPINTMRLAMSSAPGTRHSIIYFDDFPRRIICIWWISNIIICVHGCIYICGKCGRIMRAHSSSCRDPCLLDNNNHTIVRMFCDDGMYTIPYAYSIHYT